MPYSDKQRKYFHAASARGEKGMSSLAAEADRFAKDEPDGYAHGGMVCPHCGGDMDDMGELEATVAGVTDEPVEQGEAGERMREAAFVDSISRRRRRVRE